jgi:beta-mannosidase
MFACGMVPGANTRLPDFTENVEREIREQARRLRRHPSLALWCGNNEIAEGWARWGWQNGRSKKELRKMEADYRALFEEAMPTWLSEEDPYTAYWPSSPSYGRADPRAYTMGDAHDWWVWHDGRPFKSLEYRQPRFMSEFGFQAYPDLRTIAAWRGGLPELMDTADAFLKAHQKHPRGAEQIHRFLLEELGDALPDSFAHYVYLSQWLQGEGMARAVAAQRRNRPWTMGSLYWQFNDVWPAVSWSGIDVDGRWKAMQYRLQRAYAPIAPSLWVDSVEQDGRMEERWGMTLVNDTRKAEQVVWSVQIFSAAGEMHYDAAGYTQVKPGRVDTVWKAEKQNMAALQREDAVLYTEIRRMGEILGHDARLICSPCSWPLDESGLTYRIEWGSDGWPELLLRVEHPAIGIWLHSPYEGRFSENGFDLMPGREVRVSFDPPFGRKPDWNVEIPDPVRFAESLRVFSLGDVLEGPRKRAALEMPLDE